MAQREPVIALAATFSCDPAVRWIRHWLNSLGITIEVRLAPYGQLLSELSAPSIFRGAAACIGLLNFADWQRHQGAFDHEKFESDIQLLVDCIIASLSTLPRLILLICPSRPSAAAAAYTAAAERLDALAHEHPRLSVLSPTALAAWYPVAEPHDIVGETLGLPYTEQLFCAIGGASARGLLPLLAPSSAGLCKAVAVDCDFTLWHGAVGEVGAAAIVVEPRHVELQERLLALRQRGVLITLCSRNVAADVWSALRRGVMPLRQEHVSAFRIDPLLRKADALHSLAAELRIGVSSILFIDDNPTEIADVRASLPQVACWTFPQNHAIAKAELAHVWQLDLALRPAPTQEDSRRIASYEAEARRRADLKLVVAGAEAAAEVANAVDVADPVDREGKVSAAIAPGGLVASGAALRELHVAMNVAISFDLVGGRRSGSGGGSGGGDAAASIRDRLLQLLERSNQFNCWKRSPPPLWLLDKCEGIAMSVTDRYGSYGLVGLVLGRREGGRFRVVAFAMSCRVLGRGAEYAMLARVGELALQPPPGMEGETSASACSSVDVGVVTTERNQLARRFLTRAASQLQAQTKDTEGKAAEADAAQPEVVAVSQAQKAGSESGSESVESADDTSSGWLEALPEAWHRFPSRALSLLTFDPVAEAKADLEATMEATAAARASANGNDSSGGGMPASAAAERRLAEQRVAAALTAMPIEARSVEQVMRRHGHASGVLFPSFAAGSSGGSGGEVGAAGKIEVGVTDSAAHREATRLAMRSIWSYVLGDRIDDETPLHDDVPFASYGGDSVLAVQIISTCARHGLSLPRTLATKLEQMTIAQLLPHLETPSRAAAGATQPRAVGSAVGMCSNGGGEGGPSSAAAEAPAAAVAAPAASIRIIERDSRLPTMPLRPVGGLSACAAGDLSAAERLAATGGWHPAHAADKHGNTALMWAAGGGHLPVVRWLLESQGVAVDTTNKDGRCACASPGLPASFTCPAVDAAFILPTMLSPPIHLTTSTLSPPCAPTTLCAVTARL